MSATEISYYGAYQYGNFYYGVNPALIHQSDFFVAMAASPLSYTSAKITWDRPKAPNITQLSLRRNRFNLPDDFNLATQAGDGVQVYTGSPSGATSYTDPALSGGGFFYYTLFGFDNTIPAFQPGQSTGISPWRRLGDVAVLVPPAYNYSTLLYNRIPAWYRDSDLLLVNGNPASTDFPLSAFFGLLGFELDQIRGYADSLLSVNDAQNCAGTVLPALCQELGMPYEIKMGMAQARNLAANAVHLYKNKGTAPGITEFCSLLTGWPVQTVFMGANRLPVINDGVCQTSVGGWTLPTTATVSGFPAISIPTNGNAQASVSAVTLPGGVAPFPTYNNSGATGTTTTGAKVTVNSVPSNGNLFLVGRPVPAQDLLNDQGVGTITSSVWVWTAAAAQTITLYLYDEAGTLLNSHAVSITASTANVVQMTTSVNISTDANQPRWIIPFVEISGAANGNIYYLTQFAQYNGAAPTLYDLPRDLKIVLEPQTANLLGNPLTFTSAFPYGLDGWTSAAVSNNLGVVVPTSPVVPFGAAALQVVPVFQGGKWVVPAVKGGQIATLTTEPSYTQNPGNFANIPVVADAPYTFSIFVVGLGTALGRHYRIAINWTLSTGQVVTVSTPASGLKAAATFTRISVTAVAPFNAVSATVQFTSNDLNLTGTDVFLLCAAMFQEAATIGPYFDIWTAGVDPDLRLGSHGESMFYENIGVKLPRLGALLPNWVSSNATYTVILALGATVPGSTSFTVGAGVAFPLTLPTII